MCDTALPGVSLLTMCVVTLTCVCVSFPVYPRNRRTSGSALSSSPHSSSRDTATRSTSSFTLPALPPRTQQPTAAPSNHASPAYTFQVALPTYQDGHDLQPPWPFKSSAIDTLKLRFGHLHSISKSRECPFQNQSPTTHLSNLFDLRTSTIEVILVHLILI